MYAQGNGTSSYSICYFEVADVKAGDVHHACMCLSTGCHVYLAVQHTHTQWVGLAVQTRQHVYVGTYVGRRIKRMGAACVRHSHCCTTAGSSNRHMPQYKQTVDKPTNKPSTRWRRFCFPHCPSQNTSLTCFRFVYTEQASNADTSLL